MCQVQGWLFVGLLVLMRAEGGPWHSALHMSYALLIGRTTIAGLWLGEPTWGDIRSVRRSGR
jgi:hypothetical protein